MRTSPISRQGKIMIVGIEIHHNRCRRLFLASNLPRIWLTNSREVTDVNPLPRISMARYPALCRLLCSSTTCKCLTRRLRLLTWYMDSRSSMLSPLRLYLSLRLSRSRNNSCTTPSRELRTIYPMVVNNRNSSRAIKRPTISKTVLHNAEAPILVL